MQPAPSTQKKGYDPRCAKVSNPFVEAYLEKQTQKSRPVGDRQSTINWIFGMLLVANIVAVVFVISATRSTVVTQQAAASDQTMTMAEAMEKIHQLEQTCVQMRNAVEFHKNAYFKMEQEHESMKAALARVVPAEKVKEVFANYSSSPVQEQPAPDENEQAVQTARDAAVTAQLAPQPANP
jgi:hypothetical protein